MTAPATSEPLVPHTRPDPLYHIAILAMCASVLGLAFVLSVRDGTQVLVPVLGRPLPELCMFKRMTGWSCPGCGMTRCFISLAHGDLRAAWHYNPAGLLLFAVMAVQIPLRTVQLIRIRRGLPELRMWTLTQATFAVLGIILVGQWLLRLVGVNW
ncbi:MAG: DUF2752 domain-containing protein [Pirellulaceae bacterium]